MSIDSMYSLIPIWDKTEAQQPTPGVTAPILIPHEAGDIEIPYATLRGNTSFDDCKLDGCTGDSLWDKTEAPSITAPVPPKTLDIKIDLDDMARSIKQASDSIRGIVDRIALVTYESAQRNDKPTTLTEEGRQRASAEWSRQLREKVAASREAERVQVRVDLQWEGDE